MTYKTEQELRNHLMNYQYGNKTINIVGIITLLIDGEEDKAREIILKRNIDTKTCEQLIADVEQAITDLSLGSLPESESSSGGSLFGQPVIFANGNRGRSLEVYEDFAVINVTPTVGSVITGNASDGQKIIFYADVIGIQYKRPGGTIGYLQLETSSPMMNNKSSNFFNENTFTYEKDAATAHAAFKYIFEKVREIKTGKKAGQAGVGDNESVSETEKVYSKAIQFMNESKYEKAFELFVDLEDYKDSEEKMEICASKMKEGQGR